MAAVRPTGPLWAHPILLRWVRCPIAGWGHLVTLPTDGDTYGDGTEPGLTRNPFMA